MNDADWFEDEESESKELAVAPSKDLAAAVAKLSPTQTRFLDVFVESRYDAHRARELYAERYQKQIPVKMLSGWLRQAVFADAVVAREELAAKIHGISRAQILADLSDIKRRNIGGGERKDRLALSAIELIAKCLGEFKRDHDDDRDRLPVAPSMTIEITNNIGEVVRTDVLGRGGVIVDLPRPRPLEDGAP